MRKPCRCNSSASLRALLHVQRKADSGSPRVVGATNSSNAWRSLGSARDLRPPPILRTRPASIAFPGPLLNSRIPVWTVERDKPVACAITDTPPWGNDWASLAAHSRRCRSSSTDRRAWYFLRMPATSSFRSMRKDYTIYYKCASYLCAVPNLRANVYSSNVPTSAISAIPSSRDFWHFQRLFRRDGLHIRP